MPPPDRQQLARIALDEMYQFVAVLDARGTLLEVNRAALEGGGLTLADVQGKPFWECFWWRVSTDIQNTLKGAIARAAQGEFIRYDVEVYGRAGGTETIIIDFSMIPVQDDTGTVVFIVPEGRDITEKKAYEGEIAHKNVELQALLERIRELDEIKTQFFANVSHELRTPLALILGPAERLLRADPTTTAEEQRESAHVIVRNARMLLKHVNDLLDLSKLEAKKLKIELHDTDVAELVRFIASHFDVLATERRVHFEVVTAEIPLAAVDPAKLQRVVMNLLSNAFKFVPAGGTVRVTLATSTNDLVLSVEDSGPGVVPALRQAIFERFRQGDGGADRRFSGTGLGLAIAHEFVEMHKGSIQVLDSDLGGALFQVRLPRGLVATTRAERALTPEQTVDHSTLAGLIEELRLPTVAQTTASGRLETTGRPTVLVVEDNPEMNRFISQCLARDYHVMSAFDGQQGLDQALAFTPALIVSDIMMPGVSGAQMIANRKRPEMRETPILLLSAKVDEEVKTQLLEDGAQDFVAKPFTERDLLVRVRNLVTARQSRDALREAENTKRLAVEAVNETLQNQATELEAQTEEAQALAEELEQANESLQGSLVVEEEARQQAELARERSRRLLTVATDLAKTTSVSGVAQVVVTSATDALDAGAGTFALVRRDPAAGDSFETIASAGHAPELSQRFRRYPIVAGRPLSDAVLSGEPILIESAAAWSARYPEMATAAQLPYEGLVAVPVSVRGTPIAGLSFSYRDPQSFDEARRTFLFTVTEQCALALARAMAFEEEERRRDAMAFLAEASELLAGSLDYATTLRAVASAAVPRLADWCAVDMITNPDAASWPPTVERLAVVHQDPGKVDWARSLADRLPQDWSAPTGLSRVLRHGQTEFIPVITDEMVVAAARSPEDVALLREIQLSALIIVPLVARGKTLGAVTLCMAESRRRYNAADRDLAEDLARRAAIAVDNARLFAEAEAGRASADQANKSKSEFLARMSHELRTPLNAIAGYAELMAMELHGPVTDGQRESLVRIQRSQRTLLGLIDDLLQFARLESGKVQYHFADVVVADILRDVEAMVLPELTAKDIVFEVRPVDRSITAWADSEKVSQIIRNLVSNAMKFTTTGSVTVSCEWSATQVSLIVRDTGVGIPGPLLESIFEPFVQLEPALTRRVHGSGLGLAISRDLARAMGGELTAESQERFGSVFTLCLLREEPRGAT